MKAPACFAGSLALLIAGCSHATRNAAALPGASAASAATLAGRPGCPALPALDSAQLISDLYRIADDSMRGRLIGSTGDAKARDFLAARFDAIGLKLLAPGRLQEFNVDSTARRRATRGWNVVGVIPGSRLPDSYIVITAHYDHIGVAGSGSCRAIGADSICNGADDNGSGTVALLQLARYFARTRPVHSLVFAELDGEEAGLLGARAFVANPPVPLARIALNVNLDMVSRNVKNELYAAGPGRTPSLEPLVQAVADCAPITLLIGHDRPGSMRDDWTTQSDQGAFAAKGIPFVYFGVEDHPDYHRPGDSADHVMPAFFVAAVRTIATYVQRYDQAPASPVSPQPASPRP